MKNVVLLGGSNSVKINGLQKGIRDGITKFNEGKAEEDMLEFYNFALGSSISFQNLYELFRDRNQSILKNTDLIITESNINEIANHHRYSKIPLQKIIMSIEWLYEKLYSLQIRVVVLLLPYMHSSFVFQTAIDNAHRICANRYGFNVVDMQKIYIQDNIWGFYEAWGAHQMDCIMSKMGENIVKKFGEFKKNKTIKISPNLPEFQIISPKEMISLGETAESKTLKNSVYCEEIYKIKQSVLLQFPAQSQGFTLIGIHAWNEGKPRTGSVYNSYSSIIISNKTQKLIKSSSMIKLFNTININFIVDDKTSLQFNNPNLPLTEDSEAVIPTQHSKILDYFDLIDILLAKGGEWNYPIPDNNKIIDIEKDYNFSYLVPDVKFFKEIIEEYCTKLNLQNGKTAGHTFSDNVERLERVLTQKQKRRRSFFDIPISQQS